MTILTTATTRPSSPTKTTSFDVRLDWRYRGRFRDVHRVRFAVKAVPNQVGCLSAHDRPCAEIPRSAPLVLDVPSANHPHGEELPAKPWIGVVDGS